MTKLFSVKTGTKLNLITAASHHKGAKDTPVLSSECFFTNLDFLLKRWSLENTDWSKTNLAKALHQNHFGTNTQQQNSTEMILL